jgi:hypothetical protein
MRTIDILIPSPEEAEYHAEALDQARDYAAAFARAGLDLRPLPWTDPQAGRAPALALLAWGITSICRAGSRCSTAGPRACRCSTRPN